MKHLRYMGEFASVAGVAWRVEVWQEADTAFSVVGGLEFPADAPLVIEWGNKSKEEVICGSVATLKIISPGDRTYEDLYSIEAGRVRMDVYRNTLLYWSGCMDTEFYEEPYETLNGYEVTLTFSDFGILDRLKYDLSGMQTLHGIINYCADRCGISYGGIDSSMVSTQLEASGGALDLKSLKVRSDNFYDEDGEASALAKVIDGILQPLALRMVQRCGKIYVYDLNGLYNKAAVKQIIWDGASQTLGVDKVCNNAKVTWSPYAQTGNLLPTECWTEPVDENAVSYSTQGTLSGNSVYLSYHSGTDPDEWGTDDSCFTLWLSRKGKNAEISSNSGGYVCGAGGLGEPLFFKVVPQYGGTECEGVALAYSWLRQYRNANPNRMQVDRMHAQSVHSLHNGLIEGAPGNTVFKSAEASLPAADDPSSLLVRVSIEMMMDPRENPFENAFDWGSGSFKYHTRLESKSWQDQWKARGNYVYAPVLVFFQAEDGGRYFWNNMETICSAERGFTLRGPHDTFGEWKPWDDSMDSVYCGYLAWYDPSNLKESSGVANGWQKNRPAIPSFIEGNLPYAVEHAEEGQCIPYPPYGAGKLWVEVLDSGWMIYDAGTAWDGAELSSPYNIWGKEEEDPAEGSPVFGSSEENPPKISHIWMKLPEVEVVNNRPFNMGIEDEEVEYSAELNPSAKEPIEIDTICGTSVEGVPTARGAYFKAADNKQVRQLTRAGRTAPAEELLIGTLYSQYAQRRTTLSGEAQILHDPVVVYKEDNQGDKRFMMAEDVQDVRMDTSEATFVEFRPDEYDKLEVETSNN